MKRIIALLSAAALCLVFAACGAQTKTDTAADSASDSPTAGDDSTVYATVEEYISSPEITAEMKSVEEAVGDVMTFDYYAEGDKLIYDYTYTTDFEEDSLDELKESLDEALEKNASGYSQVAEVLARHVPSAEKPQVELIYRSSDGSVITSRTYE